VTTGNEYAGLIINGGKIKNFIREDGLQGNEFSERSILKTKEYPLNGGTTDLTLFILKK